MLVGVCLRAWTFVCACRGVYNGTSARRSECHQRDPRRTHYSHTHPQHTVGKTDGFSPPQCIVSRVLPPVPQPSAPMRSWDDGLYYDHALCCIFCSSWGLTGNASKYAGEELKFCFRNNTPNRHMHKLSLGTHQVMISRCSLTLWRRTSKLMYFLWPPPALYMS